LCQARIANATVAAAAATAAAAAAAATSEIVKNGYGAATVAIRYDATSLRECIAICNCDYLGGFIQPSFDRYTLKNSKRFIYLGNRS